MSLKTPAGIAQAGRSLKLLRNVPWYTSARPTIAHITAFVSVNSGSTANTYGAWAQLVASTSANIGLIYLDGQSSASNGLDNSVMWNIGVGAAGSETAIVSDFATGGSGNSGYGAWIPVSIPSGSRVALQVKTARATAQSRFPNWYLFSTGAEAYSVTPRSVDVLGSAPSTSRGTALSGAANSWTEIVASTSRPYQSLYLMPTVHGTNTATITARLVLGFGPSGSEVEAGEAVVSYTVNEWFDQLAVRPTLLYHCGPIPAGTRIAVKHNIASSPEQYGCNIIAVPYA